MSLEGELELIQLVRKLGLNYEHRLEQKRITDFFYDLNPGARRACEDLLRKNRMLPRKKATRQIDLLVWKDGHWAALAIEEKNQNGASKSLSLYKDNIVLTADYGHGSKQIADFGRDLSLQCRGESYLGKAYLAANSLDYEVIPVAVVDYSLKINSLIDTGWAFNRGIFFINKGHFEWFLAEYNDNRKWIRKVYNRNPKIFYDSAS